jgi:hypothetical protein
VKTVTFIKEGWMCINEKFEFAFSQIPILAQADDGDCFTLEVHPSPKYAEQEFDGNLHLVTGPWNHEEIKKKYPATKVKVTVTLERA